MQLIKNIYAKLNSPGAVSSGVWVVVGMVSSQGLRLASNLALTRLLVPEYFGLMALMSSLLVVFVMISDLGINRSVINSERGHEPGFLSTAWTIQFMQGCGLAVLVALSAYPLSTAYDQPELFHMLLAASGILLINGSRSMSLVLLAKQLQQNKLIRLELVSQLIGTVVMIVLAVIYRNVWALFSGYAVTIIVKCIASHVLFSYAHSRFHIDKPAVSEIIGFGKWIFLSSIFGVITTQADVIIMAVWMNAAELGKYSIASVFASGIFLLAHSLSDRVLHPLFRKFIDQPTGLASVQKNRTRLNFAFVSVCAVLAVGGHWIIEFLYDDRYIEAGWMLQFLAVGKIGMCLTSTLKPFIHAKGDSFSSMLHQIVLSAALAIAMIAGGAYFGVVGIILAYSIVPIFAFPVLVFAARKHEFHCAKADSLLVLGALIIIGLGWWLTDARALQVLGL